MLRQTAVVPDGRGKEEKYYILGYIRRDNRLGEGQEGINISGSLYSEPYLEGEGHGWTHSRGRHVKGLAKYLRNISLNNLIGHRVT